MRKALSAPFLLFLLLASATAQQAIYRCGNEYTNTATEEQMKNCKLVSGGNITIIQNAKPAPKASGAARSAPDAAASRPDAAQRQRDADSRSILESELKRSESRLAELTQEYNGGEPEKHGDETRNFQKYLDRVADLKANIARTQSDIEGIKRELSRLPANR